MQSFRGMPCSLRIASFAGLPCAPQSTVVGAHLPVFGRGIGTKVSDLFVVAACQRCHDMLDERDLIGAEIRKSYPGAYADRLLKALCETQSRWIADGLVVVPKAKVI
ncbi:nuclease domain-containing protein [Jannaschia pagri]|nr:nuclease domain-containing protein [Jannaschia sp. AI_62]